MEVDTEMDIADEMNKYLRGEKSFRICIANVNDEVILPTIETSIDDIQEHVQKLLEYWRNFSNLQSQDIVVPPQEMDVNFVNSSGQTTLHIAVQKGNAELVKLMLPKHSANVNKVDSDGKTSLHYSLGNEELMSVFIHTEDINLCQTDGEGKTILHHYCSLYAEHCNRETIEFIIFKASQCEIKIISMRNNYSDNPFLYARQQGNYHILEILGAFVTYLYYLEKYRMDFSGVTEMWKFQPCQFKTNILVVFRDIVSFSRYYLSLVYLRCTLLIFGMQTGYMLQIFCI